MLHLWDVLREGMEVEQDLVDQLVSSATLQFLKALVRGFLQLSDLGHRLLGLLHQTCANFVYSLFRFGLQGLILLWSHGPAFGHGKDGDSVGRELHGEVFCRTVFFQTRHQSLGRSAIRLFMTPDLILETFASERLGNLNLKCPQRRRKLLSINFAGTPGQAERLGPVWVLEVVHVGPVADGPAFLLAV